LNIVVFAFTIFLSLSSLYFFQVLFILLFGVISNFIKVVLVLSRVSPALSKLPINQVNIFSRYLITEVLGKSIF
jgi:hypothetical protein